MTIFLTALKRISKQPINLVFILLFPLIFTALVLSNQNGDANINVDATAGMSIGVADQDNTTLSQTLVQQLKMRYTVQELTEEDIPAVLTNSEVPWVLLIREGYERDILSGRTPVIEGYSLTLSDVSALGNVSAESITRALMLLGSDDPAVLAAWEENARVDTTILPVNEWRFIAFWLGFYGYISMFTAYFIIRTLTEDKRGSMPDRLGVSPKTPRNILIQGTMAAFLVTEITAVLILLIMRLLVGSIPNMGYLFLLLSLYNLFTVGLVLAIVSILRSLGAASIVMLMVSTVFAMLGGIFWPLEIVPEFMQRLAWVSPGYWLSRGLADIPSITFEGFGLPMLFLAGFTIVSLLLGGWKRIQPIEE